MAFEHRSHDFAHVAGDVFPRIGSTLEKGMLHRGSHEVLENSGQSKLDDADLTLIKKYKPQLEEAEKKYRKQAGSGR